MCYSLDFFDSYESRGVPLHLQLLDGTNALVTHTGKASFSLDFLLEKSYLRSKF